VEDIMEDIISKEIETDRNKDSRGKRKPKRTTVNRES
jgi:hypothetical protein